MSHFGTFTLCAEIRLADGEKITSYESHEIGVRCPETGGTIIAYSPEFAFERGEALAAEMGGTLIDVDAAHYYVEDHQ